MLFAPPHAEARDMSGKGGIGVLNALNTELRRPAALSFRYWRSTIAFEALVALDWLQRDHPQDNLRETQLGLALLVRVLDTPHISATIGIRGWAQYSWTLTDDPAEEESFLGLLIEVPLQVEFFLSDHSSLIASVGPSVLFSQRLKSSLSPEGSSLLSLQGGEKDLDKRGGIAVDLGGGFSGGIGFTYYF
jgi:hypothetical protein